MVSSGHHDTGHGLPRASPLWFGPETAPVFGWLHEPAGETCRGAVVICPAMGQERSFSHYFLRLVADRLAASGFLAVRFDYPGTGDSGDVDPDDAVEAWLTSVELAVDLARQHTSAPLTLVGLRLGALLAVEHAQHHDDVAGLVLLEPPRSGRALLRELRLRHNAALGDDADEDGSVVAVGSAYSSETVKRLSALNLSRLRELPCDGGLIIAKPGRHAIDPAVTGRSGAALTRLEQSELDEMLLVEPLPREVDGLISDWMDHTFTDVHDLERHQDRPEERELRLVHSTEHARRVGPHGLFAIVSEPHEPTTSTTLFFTPDLRIPHGGLAGMWTELSRDLAAQGVRAVRFDVSGCGDSPPRPGAPGHRGGLLEHLDDVSDAIRATTTDPGDLVLVGLCSGAYLSLEAAMDVAPRGLVLVNADVGFMAPEAPTSPRRKALQTTRPFLYRTFGPLVGRLGRRFAPQRKDAPFQFWDRWLEACVWQSTLRRRFGDLPEWLWRVFNVLLLSHRLDQSLRAVTRRGTRVMVLAGDLEWRAATLGAQRSLDRISRGGRLEMLHLSTLDHSAFRRGQKALVLSHIRRHVLRCVAADRARDRV